MTRAELAKHFMISKEDKVCFNCKHFRQHYIYTKFYDRYMDYAPCGVGHCTTSRIKSRKPTQKACEHFEWKNGDGNVWQKKSVDYASGIGQVERQYRYLYIWGYFDSGKY